MFAIDDEQRCVRFFGGVCINGANYDLFRALGGQCRFHAENGPEKENHEFVGWARLTDTLGISEHTLRQRIIRSRRSLSRQFREKLGWTLDQNEIIDVPVLSRLPHRDVTTRLLRLGKLRFSGRRQVTSFCLAAHISDLPKSP